MSDSKDIQNPLVDDSDDSPKPPKSAGIVPVLLGRLMLCLNAVFDFCRKSGASVFKLSKKGVQSVDAFARSIFKKKDNKQPVQKAPEKKPEPEKPSVPSNVFDDSEASRWTVARQLSILAATLLIAGSGFTAYYGYKHFFAKAPNAENAEIAETTPESMPPFEEFNVAPIKSPFAAADDGIEIPTAAPNAAGDWNNSTSDTIFANSPPPAEPAEFAQDSGFGDDFLTPMPDNSISPKSVAQPEKKQSTAAFPVDEKPKLAAAPPVPAAPKNESLFASKTEETLAPIRKPKPKTPEFSNIATGANEQPSAALALAAKPEPKISSNFNGPARNPLRENVNTNTGPEIPNEARVPIALTKPEPNPFSNLSTPPPVVADIGPRYEMPIHDSPATAAALPKATAFVAATKPEKRIAAENGQLEKDQYIVQDGDNYWGISDKIYGSGLYYKALAEHNKKSVPYPAQLAAGTKIEVPDVQRLRSRYADLCPALAADGSPLRRGATVFGGERNKKSVY